LSLVAMVLTRLPAIDGSGASQWAWIIVILIASVAFMVGWGSGQDVLGSSKLVFRWLVSAGSVTVIWFSVYGGLNATDLGDSNTPEPAPSPGGCVVVRSTRTLPSVGVGAPEVGIKGLR
jgi:hypothetical protein